MPRIYEIIRHGVVPNRISILPSRFLVILHSLYLYLSLSLSLSRSRVDLLNNYSKTFGKNDIDPTFPHYLSQMKISAKLIRQLYISM